MPTLELAHVRLKPADATPASTPLLTPEFIATWRAACAAASAASHTRFSLYQAASSPADLFLIGGWRDPEEHVRFLAGGAAKEVAAQIGRFCEVVKVRHDGVGGLAGLGLLADEGQGVARELAVRLWKVEGAEIEGWEARRALGRERQAERGQGGLVAGWDLSTEIQAGREEFKEMHKLTGGREGAFAADGSADGKEKWWVEIRTLGEKHEAVKPEEETESRMLRHIV